MMHKVSLAALVAIATAAPSSAPNFVIMLADDMGWGDWSRTGAPARTPNLDAMSRADTAVWFQRAYSGNPICSPTRASLHTGRTPARSCIYGVEQHVLCVAGKGGCARSEYGLGNATRDAKEPYLSGFYGKWHLGSLSNRGIGSPDCYKKPDNESCQLGYWERDDLSGGVGCCFGVDSKLDISHPLNFGYDEFVATPECAASATTNCGCFFYPSPHNDTPCELGHYHQHPGAPPYNECMQYYVGNATGPARASRRARDSADGGHSLASFTSPGLASVAAAAGASGDVGYAVSIEPIDYVSSVDDEEFLVDQVERLIVHAVSQSRPFLAVIAFHGVHIPYVATPETRATYPGMTTNEQDYWGTITQIDAQVGRIRALLVAQGVADRTWVSITADNGPEVNPAGGQGTGSFPNPGLTGGLRGRKRDTTEGGTRVIGLVEGPATLGAKRVRGGRVEPRFPIVTSDLMPTVLDALGLPAPPGGAGGGPRHLDGISLLPFLRGNMTVRPQEAGVGIHGIFEFGETNHVQLPNGTQIYPYTCPTSSNASSLGDIPAGFSTPGNQPQFSWAEGNHLKVFGCTGDCKNKNCTPEQRGWHFFLYNLTSDRAETIDLWAEQRATAKAMLARFQQWQADVVRSQGPEENGCNPPSPTPGPPAPHVPITPVPGMSNDKARCSDKGGNKLGNAGGSNPNECALHCKAKDGCGFFSFSTGCDECWLYAKCDPPHPINPGLVYNWSTYQLLH